MAAPTSPLPNSVATLSVPRVRFIFASIFVLSSTIYALSRIISGIDLPALYKSAMFCSFFTELLTLKLYIPVFSMSPEVLNVISSSPVLPHVMLSMFLWISPTTFLVQLISITMVYFFLVIEYIPTDSVASHNPYWRVYGKPLADSMIPKKPFVLNLAAHFEILNLVLVLVSILRMNGNLIHLLVFTQYLVSQYISSPITNQAIRFWDSLVSRLLNDPRCPPAVKVVELKVREVLVKLLGFTNQFIRQPQPVPNANRSTHKPNH